MKYLRAIIGTSNFWSSPFQVGMHQIARSLVKMGWKVAFLSAPISPFHILNYKNNRLSARYKIYKNNGITEFENQLWAYVPGSMLTHNNQTILRSSWLQKNWAYLSLPSLKTMLKKKGFEEVDLILVDNIDFACLGELIPHSRIVYRVADNNHGFKNFTQAQRENEKYFASNIDLVFYSAHNLENYVINLQPQKRLFLPNGVNFQHFQGDWEIPNDLAAILDPIVIYVGAMDYWFDFKLIEYTANEMPEVSFILIGPDREARNHLSRSQNVHILGPKPYSELPKYLHQSSLGIIPFNLQDYPDLVNSINPLKLYEYFSCGLPVVATAWDELNNLKSPAYLYGTPSEFINCIKQALTATQDQRKTYVEYARQQDWSIRISNLLEELKLN